MLAPSPGGTLSFMQTPILSKWLHQVTLLNEKAHQEGQYPQDNFSSSKTSIPPLYRSVGLSAKSLPLSQHPKMVQSNEGTEDGMPRCVWRHTHR